jgi:hypothetical protein
MTYAALIALDDRLAARGVPPLSPWWRHHLSAWYAHPTALTLVACSGRGAAKSTALYKVALTETLFGTFAIPPGERHWASLTSRLKDEAAKGIQILSSWLTILNVGHDASDGIIELAQMPRGFRNSAASVGGNTGWRSIFDGNDETGKLPTEGAMAVDAVEVLASKRAMTATHPTARHMIVSTPFVDSGPFFEMVTAGSNEHTYVAGPAPTWVVAPHITEEQTRRLEPNESIHAREYGASFAAEWQHGYFTGLIEPSTGPYAGLPYNSRYAYSVAIDPAFSKDLFAIAVAHRDGEHVIVDRIEAIAPPRGGEGLSPTSCLQRVREVADEYRASNVRTDQFSAATLTELASREGLTLIDTPWTASSKRELFDYVRVLMRDRKLTIPNDKPLIRELSGIGVKLTSSGHESIQARPGYTDDRVSAMVMAAHFSKDAVPPGFGPSSRIVTGSGYSWGSSSGWG